MGQLVLLVVAAAWAAVLIPPLLRSRIENRPNSSVTDFRRQLNRLQSTVPARASGAGSLRPVGRQLAPSPLHRPAAGGRPLERREHRDPRAGASGGTAQRVPSGRTHGQMQAASIRPRAHEDRTGGHARAHRQTAHRQTAHRQTTVSRSTSPDIRRRRSNVLFLLAMTAASTLFLAATTKAAFMLYAFALSFLALCGYVYLLAQLRQREQQSWPNSWVRDHHRAA